jgi:chromosome segregation ATPase
MEPRHGSEQRVIRLADAPETVELESSDVLARLEAQAAENGRLEAKAESFERVARAERDARRRLADTLKRERKAAEALHEHAQQAEAQIASHAQEIERLERAVALAEQQKHVIWIQLTESERRLAHKSRPLWRKLLFRPPAA